jgi:nucleoid DNA-binding protein/DNA-binding phage protein
MPLTRDFRETIQARASRDPEFRLGLLKEAIECMLEGEVDTGKIVLRDYINATSGFQELAAITNKSPKSLMRMFGPKGNPQASNLFEILEAIQKREKAQFEVKVKPRSQSRNNVSFNKNALISKIAYEANISMRQAAVATQAVLDGITDTLKRGQKINLVGFGTFSVSKRAARTSRNPATGATIDVPAANVPKFKAGKVLKDAVR